MLDPRAYQVLSCGLSPVRVYSMAVWKDRAQGRHPLRTVWPSIATGRNVHPRLSTDDLPIAFVNRVAGRTVLTMISYPLHETDFTIQRAVRALAWCGAAAYSTRDLNRSSRREPFHVIYSL